MEELFQSKPKYLDMFTKQYMLEEAAQIVADGTLAIASSPAMKEKELFSISKQEKKTRLHEASSKKRPAPRKGTAVPLEVTLKP